MLTEMIVKLESPCISSPGSKRDDRIPLLARPSFTSFYQSRTGAATFEFFINCQFPYKSLALPGKVCAVGDGRKA